MKVIGSIIARLGSKRLAHKNLMPCDGHPLIGLGIRILLRCQRLDAIIVSTEDELIARVARDYGAVVLRRPEALAGDKVPSIPVFQHIARATDADIHVNYNINFPICPPEAIDDAVLKTQDLGEVLSVPFAIWGQSKTCLENYGDPWNITAHQYPDDRVGPIDIHTYDDLLELYRQRQGSMEGW